MSKAITLQVPALLQSGALEGSIEIPQRDRRGFWAAWDHRQVASSLLDRVRDRYLSSGDFNGYFFNHEHATDHRAAIELVRAGLVEVVTEEDYPNPSIRPWTIRRSADEQIVSIDRLTDSHRAMALYPTAAALKDWVAGLFPDRPYSQRMAEGRGTLELAYFDFAVLEQYRNDPRFSFRFDDFGANVVIGDEAYVDESEPAHDKIIMSHIGFAYDLSRFNESDADAPIWRRVCAFYGDLAKLSARHQQRWGTYQLDDEAPLAPHPVWIGQEMGHWADGIGPFIRLFCELECLNELFERAFGQPLLETTNRPDGFGWILRPTQDEWDRFVRELDKVLSENIKHKALTAAGVPRKNDAGESIGTLLRLELLLTTKRIDASAVKQVLQPLREVRAARQAPSHALRTNVTDQTFVRKQVELLGAVNFAVEHLRRIFQTHPANADWNEPKHLTRESTFYRF
jgi:hypothetical protein